uniref:Uncharacterized protein n=1 Tax=Magnetococcus massalia (strain MO-1) TaxID=451514 RepID=A0A1S7LJM9_MAGMO|nr:Protein of unknown function [Candidatus Magnetococcus massalia]
MAEWQSRAGEDCDLLELLLRPTQRLARAYHCPTPGGLGCPRRIVLHENGDVFAVCANEERSCDTLSLEMADIIVYEMDVRQLAQRIAGALEVPFSFSDKNYPHGVIKIGEDHPYHDQSLQVFMALHGSREKLRSTALELSVLTQSPFLLLILTQERSTDLDSLLSKRKSIHLPMDQAFRFGSYGELKAQQPATFALASLRNALAPQAQNRGLTELFPTPASASWKSLILEFHADELMLAKCGSVVRRVEPEHMGMKNRKSGRPTHQWTMLRALAITEGTLPLPAPEEQDRIKKQKSELSRKLKAYFQLSHEPIPWKQGKKYWEAEFQIRGVNLREPTNDDSEEQTDDVWDDEYASRHYSPFAAHP